MKKQYKEALIINLFVASGMLLLEVVRSFLYISYEVNADGNVVGTMQPNDLYYVTISFILWIVLDICTRNDKKCMYSVPRTIVTIGYCYALFMVKYIPDYFRSWFLLFVLIYIIFVQAVGLLRYFIKIVKEENER